MLLEVEVPELVGVNFQRPRLVQATGPLHAEGIQVLSDAPKILVLENVEGAKVLVEGN